MHRVDRILLASDLEYHAADTWREACELARVFGSRINLVHAIGFEPTSAEFGICQGAAYDELNELHDQAKAEGVDLGKQLFVRSGEAAQTILVAAEESNPDLIVIGAGTKTILDRVLLGSVAERISREADRPVWLVRPGKHRKHPGFQRVACAVDASEPAKEALATAIFLARTFTAKLSLVSVVEKETDTASGKLADALGAFDLHGVDCEIVIREGKPAKQILEAIYELESDVLVMGSAGRKGLARLLRPNTAEKILRVVPCSLLTVKASGG